MAEEKEKAEAEEDVKLLARMFSETKKFLKKEEEEEVEEGKEVS